MIIKHRPARRGTAAVEFALSVPALFIVLAIVTDLSAAVAEMTTLSRIAKDAARVGSTVIEVEPATGDSIEAAAINHATQVLGMAGYPCGVGCEVSADWGSDTSGWNFITVTIRYPRERYFDPLPALSDEIQVSFSMLSQQQP